MKVTITGSKPKPKDINWDKPQLVIHKDKTVIYTTGEHDREVFSGFDLHGCEHSKLWSKDEFTPLPPNQSVILQNE